MREATRIEWISNDISATDLTTLGTLGSVLPALDQLVLIDSSGHCSAAGFDGVQRLAAGLGAGALPSVSLLCLTNMHAGEAGASALAAALGRGALPRLEALILINAGIGDAGLVALAPVLRRLPALRIIGLLGNPLGDDGIAALVAPPPPPAGAPPPPTGGLKKLKVVNLQGTQVSDAGCAALAAALDSGALPALKGFILDLIPASRAAKAAVHAALAKRREAARDGSVG